MLFDLGMADSHTESKLSCGGKRTLRESVKSKVLGKASLERERRKYAFLSNSVAWTQGKLHGCVFVSNSGAGGNSGKKEYIVSQCLIQDIIIPPILSVWLR